MRWKSKLFQLKWIVVCVTIILSDASDASTRRHRREGEVKDGTPKKKKKDDICVYGYCLDSTYDSLELPTRTHATHVKTSLEVNKTCIVAGSL